MTEILVQSDYAVLPIQVTESKKMFSSLTIAAVHPLVRRSVAAIVWVTAGIFTTFFPTDLGDQVQAINRGILSCLRYAKL